MKKNISLLLMVTTFLFLASPSIVIARVKVNGKPIKVSKRKSLIITNKDTLNNIQNDYQFAQIIGKVSNFLDTIKKNRKVTPGKFFENIFTSGYKEQIMHKHASLPQKISVAPADSDRMLNKIFQDWKSSDELKSINSISELKDSPFRLLSVVNLMDRAGDIDDRGLKPTTMHPRSLGEIHLVYGYIDQNYEKMYNKPFPQTWVLSFRLPIIRKVKKNIKIDNVTTHESLILDKEKWSQKMKLWANLWVGLSLHEHNSKGFHSQLQKILKLAIRPENFLNVRSNTKINSKEFELREWYIVSQNLLIPRKPRREPYKCLNNTEYLEKLINKHWRPEYKDLDVTTHTITSDKHSLRRREGKNGFTVNRSYELSGLEADYGCNSEYSEDLMPFEMPEPKRPNARIKGDRMVAPFARVTKNFIWTVPGVYEKRRHAFAIRTCTGCHSKEGATFGFHVFPRLSHQNTRLSPFLTGRKGNSFSHKRKNYRYNELKTRKKWLEDSYNKKAVLFESLKLNH